MKSSLFLKLLSLAFSTHVLPLLLISVLLSIFDFDFTTLKTLLAFNLILSVVLFFWGNSRIYLKIVQKIEAVQLGFQMLKFGRMQYRIPQETDSFEFDRLIQQFNCFAEMLEFDLQKKIEEQKKLALKENAVKIAHDLKSPLASLKAVIANIEQDQTISGANVTKEAFVLHETDMEILKLALERMEFIIQDLLADWKQKSLKQSSSKNSSHVPQADLSTLVSKILLEFQYQDAFKAVQFELEKPPEVSLARMEASKLHRIFGNLIKNACEASIEFSPNNPRVSVSVEMIKAPEGHGQQILAKVKDNGGGISEEQLEKIKKCAYTSKGQQGHGIGLASVMELVKEGGGQIRFIPIASGSEIELSLPSATELVQI